jgi:hypothetical protein
MMTIQDLAHRAYQAAQERDQDAADAAVTELIARGQFDVQIATEAWMDRTTVMIGHITDGQVQLKLSMISDHSGTGITEPIQQIRQPDVAWTGRMFLAYVGGERQICAALWAAVPNGQARVYVERMLTTMALTGLAHEEGLGDDGQQDDPELTCDDVIHRWVAGDRPATGRAIAKAHLN